MTRILSVVCGVVLIALSASSVEAQNSSFSQVRCDQGQTIQNAVDNSREGALIEVSGTCSEFVLVETDGLEIVGLGATMNSPAGGDPAFDMRADGVKLSGFTINGNAGFNSITVTRGGSAHVFNNNLFGSGIWVYQGSTGILEDNEISNPISVGIVVSEGSYGQLTGNKISGAQRGGIFVGGASAEVFGNTVSGSVNGNGVTAERGSSLSIAGNTLTGNDEGIFVDQNSAIVLPSFGGGANAITNSGGFDIRCEPSGAITVGVSQILGGNGLGDLLLEPGCDVNNFNNVPPPWPPNP